jgi:hypothetical protein
MHGPINVKSPNNISKWQMRFNSPFKGLMHLAQHLGRKTEHQDTHIQGVSGGIINILGGVSLDYPD